MMLDFFNNEDHATHYENDANQKAKTRTRKPA